jgi:hypothetical protein
MRLSKIVAAAGLALVALTGATAASAHSYRWEREHRYERLHRWERHHAVRWERHHRGYDRCRVERHHGRVERICRR